MAPPTFFANTRAPFQAILMRQLWEVRWQHFELSCPSGPPQVNYILLHRINGLRGYPGHFLINWINMCKWNPPTYVQKSTVPPPPCITVPCTWDVLHNIVIDSLNRYTYETLVCVVYTVVVLITCIVKVVIEMH